MLNNNINSVELFGEWKKGWALDNHTIPMEHDYNFGDSKSIRTDIGELLYRLKYKHEWMMAWRIGRIAADFLVNEIEINAIDCIVTIPPTKIRLFFQPVKLVGWRIGSLLNIPVKRNTLKAKMSFKQMKNIYNYDERIRLMKGRLYLKSDILKGKSVLLFDDLYRSGATLNEAAKVLWENGKIKALHVLTITKTREQR